MTKEMVEHTDVILISQAASWLPACNKAVETMIALGNDLNWYNIPYSYVEAINDLRTVIAKATGKDNDVLGAAVDF